VVHEESRKRMKEILKEIQSGQFAEEWVNVYKNEGKNSFDRYIKDLENHQVEKIGKDMRKMMWPDSAEI
jgi:ketol-acid reductoisomerase